MVAYDLYYGAKLTISAANVSKRTSSAILSLTIHGAKLLCVGFVSIWYVPSSLRFTAMHTTSMRLRIVADLQIIHNASNVR
jgi:hypothetical protein